MQVRYGNLYLQANSCKIGTTNRAVLTDGEQVWAYDVEVRVEGFIAGSGQSALTTLENALRRSLAVPGGDLILYQDSGAASAVALYNANTVNGTRVTAGPDFDGQYGAEYATQRKFSFAVTARQLATGQNPLLAFSEEMSFSGGGPMFVHKRDLIGRPQKQMTWPATEYVAAQSGIAVGLFEYPKPAAARFPRDFKQSPNVTYMTPRRSGRTLIGYGVRWNYLFESVNPLVGLPTLWPLKA